MRGKSLFWRIVNLEFNTHLVHTLYTFHEIENTRYVQRVFLVFDGVFYIEYIFSLSLFSTFLPSNSENTKSQTKTKSVRPDLSQVALSVPDDPSGSSGTEM